MTATTLTFAAGVTAQTVTVTTTEDTLDEPNDEFQVKLTDAATGKDDPGATPTLTRATATGTITDDDAVPSFSVADGSGDEGDGITFVVTRTGATGNVVTVEWATAPVADGASTADFTAVAATTLTFAAGVTAQTVTVTTTDDTLDEPNEEFSVTLSKAGKADGDPGAMPTITDDTATGTITDDDAVPSFSIADGSGDEGDDITFVVTRAGATGNVVTVEWATAPVADGASTADFTAVTATTLTFAAGVTEQTVTVTTTEDTLDEPNEEFSVTLSKAGKADGDPGMMPTITDDTATGMITDDDAVPSFSIADGRGAEGDGITFVVTRAGATGNVVTVQWATATVAGEAVAADFTAVAATTLTFAAGVTAQTVTVTTTEDTLDEPNEEFQVKLTGAAKADGDPGAIPTLTRTTATGTITDDDDAPSGITLTATPASVGEAAGATTVTVTAAVNGRTRYVDQKTVTVSVAEDSATEPEDYAAVSNFTITIAPGAASGTGTFTLTPVSDTLNEPNETLDVTGVSTGLQVTGEEITITDDDGAPSFSIADGSGAEGDGITFVVTRTGATGNVVTVQWATALVAGGAITADFTAVTATTLTFAAGVTAQTVTVTTTEDTLDEPNEAFEVKLSGAAKGTNDPGAIPTITDDTATGTITDDDDVPSFAIADGRGAEGDGITFVVTRTGAVSNVVTVQWATALVANEASATDFTAVPATTLTFAAGITAQTVTVATTADVLAEADEDFQVRLSGQAKADGDPGGTPTLTRATATGTITDNDAAPGGISLGANPQSVTEDDNPTTVTVTATVKGATRYPDQKVVTVSVDDATAVSPGDYAVVADFTITIAAGAASGTGNFTLTPVNDNLYEANEEIRVTGTSGSITADPTSVRIVNTDARPDVRVSPQVGTGTNARVAEAGGAQQVTVNVDVQGDTRYAEAQTVAVSVSDGTAESPADYAAVSGFNVTIPAGAAGATGTFTVTPVNDVLHEGDETIRVSGTLTGTTILSGTVTIVDDDAEPSGITLTATPDRVGEAAGATEVVVTAAVNGTTRYVAAQTVAVRVANGTAISGTDFTAVTGFNIAIAAGAASATGTFTFNPTDDRLDEPDETLDVTGTLTGVPITTATLTITDNDDTPSFKVGDARGAEGEPLSFVVTRDGATANVVSVAWATALVSGSASASDFTEVTATTLQFAAGDTTKTVTVNTTEDVINEPNETFEVKLSGAAKGAGDPGFAPTISDDTGTGTITDDDDTPGRITLTVDEDSFAENATATAVTVTAAVQGGTTFADVQTVAVRVSGGTATSGIDYAAVPGFTIAIAAGAASATGTFTLNPTDDHLDEPDETLDVTGTLTGVRITTATLTITDNDDTPSFKVGDASAAEGEPLSFVVTRDGATANVVSVAWATALVSGSASASDFTEVTATTLQFAAGDTTKTVTVATTEDELHEGDETFEVRLSAPAKGVGDPGGTPTLSDGTGEGTIEDDDAVPTALTLTANPDSVAESAGATTVTVTAALNGASRFTTAKMVVVSVANGTATSPADYTAVSNFTITIAAGQANGTGSFTLTTANDSLVEGNETLNVTGTSAGLNVTDDEITITDDDAAPTALTLTANPDSVAESAGATTITVTAALDGASRFPTPKTVTVSVADGTATSPADYAGVSNFTITIAAGEGSGTGTFTLTPASDALVEGNETIQVSGTSAGLTVTDDEITITDDDSAPTALTLTASPDSVAESAGATTVTVTAALNGAGRFTSAKTVVVSVADGTATSSADYAAVSNFTITIAAEAASGTGSFTLTPTNDAFDEPNETIAVTGTADSLTITGDEITLEDDDAPASGITLTANPDAVGEEDGATPITVTATVNGSTRYESTTTVAVSVGGGTATSGTDYATVNTFNITIAAGQASGTGTFTLTPANDAFDEPNETIAVTGTADSLDIRGDEITLEDDDAPAAGITLTANPDAVGEEDGATPITVTATVNGNTRYEAATTVAVRVGGGASTAISGTDYGPVTGFNIVIAAGAASETGTFTLTPTNDAFDEPNETIEVSGNSGSLTVTSDEITLTDDDAAPTATLVLTPTSIDESGNNHVSTVTATLSGPAQAAVTLTVSATPGAGAAAADFTQSGTTLTIAAGSTSSTGAVTLTAVDNRVHAPDKAVTVSATASGGGVSAPADQTLTIADDDTAPRGATLSVNPTAVREDEGDRPIEVTATVDGAARAAATVLTLSVAPGTAQEADFKAVPNFTLTIAAGAASGTATFTLTPVNDLISDDGETVIVSGQTTVPGYAVIDATLTLKNYDPPASILNLEVLPASVAEDAGSTVVHVTARFGAGHRGTDTAVTITVAGDTATSPGDFAAVPSFTVTILAGEDAASGTFTLRPVDDALDEPNETIALTATTAVSDLTVHHGSLTLTDNDDAPTALTLTASPATVGEDAGATAIVVTAAVEGLSRFPTATTVTVTVADGTATAPADYTAVPAFTITIAAEAASGTGTFTLTPIQDGVAEGHETLDVTGTASGLTVTPTALTLTDDDAAPTGATLRVSPSAVNEDAGATAIEVTATVDGAARAEATGLTLAVAPGTAQAADFEAVSDFTLTIAAGAASGTATFTLTPLPDQIAEDPETIRVTGTTAVEGYTVTPATLTLNNVDPPASLVTLEVAPASVAEDAGATAVTVTARFGTGHRGTATEVTITVAGDTATVPADFAAVPPFTLTIPAGADAASGTFTLTPVDDPVHEGAETLAITGTTAAADLTVTPTGLTLTDDDAAPTGFTLTASPARVGEAAGATTLTVTAVMEGRTTFPVATPVHVSVGGGTATVDTDYTAVPDFTLTIPAGATRGRGQFTLTPIDDTVDEPDETVQVTGQAGALTGAAATVTLEDNDDISIFSLTGGTAEEGTGVRFTVTRTGGTANAATVEWATAADAAGAFPATAADYTAVPRPQALHFAPGETRHQVTVATTDDTLDEEAETFLVRLSGASATVVIAPEGREAIGTIEDNDAAPTLSLTDVTVTEGEATRFVLTLSAASGRPITVQWRTVEGSATEDVDYEGQRGQLTIPPGVRTLAVSVPTIDDQAIEDPEETFTLHLSEPQAVTFARAASGPPAPAAAPTLVSAHDGAGTPATLTGTGVILDNDRAAVRAELKQVNEALLPWVGSALLRRHLDRITGCLQEAGTAAPALDGVVERAVRYAEAQQTAQQTGGRQASLWETLGGTRLAGGVGPAASDTAPKPVTVCLGANWRRLTNDGPVRWEGALMGAHLNGHVRLSAGWRVGLDVAHDWGRLDWQLPEAGAAGDWALALTGVRPYVAWQSPAGAQVWGLIGYSGGTLAVTPPRPGAPRQRAPVTHRHAGVGGAVPVGWGGLRLRGEAWMGVLEVADNGDLLVGVRGETAGLRGLVDGEWAYELGPTQRVTPALRLGVQYDEGAGGTGVEVGTEVGWDERAWGLQGRVAARTLVVDGVVREWGLGGQVQMTAPEGLGPLLALSTARGNLTDGRAQWWDQGLGATPLGPAAPRLGVDLTAGWRLLALDGTGVVTPFVGVALPGDATRTLRVGSQLTLASGLELTLQGTRQDRQGVPSGYGLFLQVDRSW